MYTLVIFATWTHKARWLCRRTGPVPPGVGSSVNPCRQLWCCLSLSSLCSVLVNALALSLFMAELLRSLKAFGVSSLSRAAIFLLEIKFVSARLIYRATSLCPQHCSSVKQMSSEKCCATPTSPPQKRQINPGFSSAWWISVCCVSHCHCQPATYNIA